MARVAQRHLSLLLQYLGGAEHMNSVRAMLQHVEGLDAAQHDPLIEEIAQDASSLRLSLGDLIVEDDTSEAEIVLPFIWLEKRFEWMRLNAQMQYQTVFRGRADPILMARGAALSALIGVVESFLPPEAVFLAAKVAADPLGIARAELTRNERLFQSLEAAGIGGRMAVEAIATASAVAARFSSDERLLSALDTASTSVIAGLGRDLRLNVDDFRIALEAEIVALLADSPLHVALESTIEDVGVVFPAVIAREMRRIVRLWIARLVHATGGPAARITAGRKANLTLTLNVIVTPGQFTMHLTDDGDGTHDFILAKHDRGLRDMYITHTCTPGVGSTLSVRCGLRSMNEYLIVTAGAEDTDATIAIPLRSVERMSSGDAHDLAVHRLVLDTAQENGALPIVDLGARLYDTEVDPAAAMYVIVQCETAQGIRRVALRVRELRGTCRGSLRYVPEHCPTEWLLGFVMNRRQMVGVLDLARVAA